ncbi:MAG TPA: hypothetical protein VKW76_06395 [Candidatus Binatia bacterium]|nr:hypothetical protein [Candidatus Binatia bacterium]
MRGLRAIAERPAVVRRLFVHLGGDRRRTPDGVEVLPPPEFAELLATGRLFRTC